MKKAKSVLFISALISIALTACNPLNEQSIKSDYSGPMSSENTSLLSSEATSKLPSTTNSGVSSATVPSVQSTSRPNIIPYTSSSAAAPSSSSSSVSQHTHTYSDEWSYDATHHWHAATCGHDVVADKAEHAWGASGIDVFTGVISHRCTICFHDEILPPELCEVRWLNYDGSVLETENYYTGETPTYKGETPVRPEDEDNTYTFSGWSPRISVVLGNDDYTAQFEAHEKVHTHRYVRNEETLEYVCSCGAKNGRDYRFEITFPEEIHVGDSFDPWGYEHSFTNDDNALAFCTVMFEEPDARIYASIFNDDTEIPATFENKEIIVHIYIGVVDETYIKYGEKGGYKFIENLEVYCNGEETYCNQDTMSISPFYIPAGKPTAINDAYYHYTCRIGPVLPVAE